MNVLVTVTDVALVDEDTEIVDLTEPLSDALADAVGTFVTIVDTPGCRYSSGEYSRQYDTGHGIPVAPSWTAPGYMLRPGCVSRPHTTPESLFNVYIQSGYLL